jgi:hypothetical protein
MKQHLVLAALVVLHAVPSNARAADGAGIRGRWSVSFQGGTDVEVSGNCVGGAQGSVLGLPTTVEARGYGDAYRKSFRGRFSVGYGVSPSVEVFLRGSHYATTASEIQAGNVAGLPLRATFGEYQEWGAEAGIRYHFHPERPLKPYVAGVAGVLSLKEATASFGVPAANVALDDLPFFDKSMVGVAGVDFGASFDISRHVAVGGEVGLRYQTKRSGIDTALTGTNLETINDDGSRLSFPILGQITLRF